MTRIIHQGSDVWFFDEPKRRELTEKEKVEAKERHARENAEQAKRLVESAIDALFPGTVERTGVDKAAEELFAKLDEAIDADFAGRIKWCEENEKNKHRSCSDGMRECAAYETYPWMR